MQVSQRPAQLCRQGWLMALTLGLCTSGRPPCPEPAQGGEGRWGPAGVAHSVGGPELILSFRFPWTRSGARARGEGHSSHGHLGAAGLRTSAGPSPRPDPR